MHVQARIRGDLESVVSWWTSAERREAQRARYESLDVSDFRYEETLEDGQRITEAGWTTRRGIQVSLRMASPIRPHGAVERAPDGRAVLRTQSVTSHRWPDGREVLHKSDFTFEFTELSEGRTRVRLTVARYKAGPRWGETAFPHQDERFRLRMHLKQTITKCEYRPGTRKPAKRWLAVY